MTKGPWHVSTSVRAQGHGNAQSTYELGTLRKRTLTPEHGHPPICKHRPVLSFCGQVAAWTRGACYPSVRRPRANRTKPRFLQRPPSVAALSARATKRGCALCRGHQAWLRDLQ
eukprot:2431661-Alexandrium_andersonii.AAC.1